MAKPVDWGEISDLITVLRAMEMGAFPLTRAEAHAALVEIEQGLMERQKKEKGTKSA